LTEPKQSEIQWVKFGYKEAEIDGFRIEGLNEKRIKTRELSTRVLEEPADCMFVLAFQALNSDHLAL